MPVRRTPLALVLCLVVPVASGCGNEQALPPDVATPGPRLGSNPARYDAAGIRFDAPAGWNVRAGEPPLVAVVTTGRASISIFRYPRGDLPLPRRGKALDGALDALVGAARLRDPSFVELRRSRRRVDGRPAVTLRGTETVDGQPRTVRSTHAYAFRGEVVVDALAPAADFPRVDREVFGPLVRSVELSKPAA